MPVTRHMTATGTGTFFQGNLEDLPKASAVKRLNQNVSGSDRMSLLPPISEGSIRSVTTTASQKLRRQYDNALKEEALKEQQRRAAADLERLNAELRLFKLKSQVEEEDDADDHQNEVRSVVQGAPDVDLWVSSSVYEKQIQEEQRVMQNLHQPALDVDSTHPTSYPLYNGIHPMDVAQHLKGTVDQFKLMAESFKEAMTKSTPQQSSSDMNKFLARQSGGKDLPDFSGDPEEWPTFHGRFVSSTEVCGFNKEENLLRLQRSLKGRAKESVVSMLSSSCNVEDIMEVLRKLFGRPEQVIEKMLAKAKMAVSPTEGDFQSLLDFTVGVKNVCATAEALKMPLYLNNPQVIKEFRNKLPSSLQLKWGKRVEKLGTSMDLKEFSKFLDEISAAAVHVCDSSVSSSQFHKKRNKEHCFVMSDDKCILGCKEQHSLEKCFRFKKMKVADRWDCAKTNGVCFNCLGKGHPSFKCPNEKKCGKDGCTKSHHQSLHRDQRQQQQKENVEVLQCLQEKMHGSSASGSANVQPFVLVSQVNQQISSVLLKIVPVQLVGPKGQITVNAFLDDGSTVTMLDAAIANRLGLDGECKPLHLSWQGGGWDTDNSSKVVSLGIRGIHEDKEYRLDNVRTKKNLLLPVQPMSDFKNLRKWNHFNDVEFPKPLPERPVIVIGEDNCKLMLQRDFREGPRNAPVATKTYLGWVVHGPTGRFSGNCKDVSMINVEHMNPDEALHEIVKEQFLLDALGAVNSKTLPMSKINERAERIMQESSVRVGDSWETAMLWKTDDLQLPESRSTAYRRLQCLEKQLDKDATLAEMYEKKIEEYVAKGFCRKLGPEELSNSSHQRIWYLPHFGRTNPNKPGKLRLVFDCAAKVNGTSLNDALIQGPDLMSPLINVLMRFREREVAFSGDIRDMFHMVKIGQKDVPTLRFLWRGKNRDVQPNVYQMEVMVFGAVSSPYQAQWIKNRNAMDFEEMFPEAVDAIVNRHYVDDYLDSCSTVEDAITKIMQVRDIHRRGGFEIRGWLCNQEDVLKVVCPGELNITDTFNVKEKELERVLGLFWDPKLDIFKFKTSFRNVDATIVSGERIPSKRELLKLVMSLFDPLGFISHLTIRGRILLQDVWRSGVGWDQQLTESLRQKWMALLDQIHKIPDSIIRRCYAEDISKAQDIQLHILCDASQQAYGAVAYFRVTGRGGGVSVNIVFAKFRVAPIKCTSIPRLELEAAVVGARVVKFVKENIGLTLSATFIWSDSRNVLCWLRADDPRRFKMFIGHRIGVILDATDVSQWKWVPTKDNVADDATMDMGTLDLSPSSRWFNGPAFLYKPECEWPMEMDPATRDVNPEDLEMKRDFCFAIVEREHLLTVTDYSDWLKVIRITAWILRFGRNSKPAILENRETRKWLQVNEIRDAILYWVKICQEDCFSEDLCQLRHNEPLEKSSRLLKLSPVLLDGVLCVKSRLVNAPIVNPNPVILDVRHPWTQLLLKWYHTQHGHHGVETICNEVRQSYWIPGLKSALKKITRECLECKMKNAKQVAPEMAALPSVRVTRPGRPFTYVGVDYFGPIDVVNGRKHEKRYGVLFTCLSIRAVHLEMAYSLSTDDFIMALHRFTCRRGNPVELWSDNGTNFRGADVELKKNLEAMDQTEVGDKLSLKGIKWTFIPPGAPHMGGAWERLVRSVKTAIGAVLKNRTMSDQMLLTVLAEAEASVNSRPLTTVSDDKDDPNAITPNCFLIGSTSVKQPPGVFSNGDLCSQKRWRQCQVLADHFWNRWTKEYLPSLALRKKWNQRTEEIRVGDLVFIADMNQLRNNWIKGIVEAVYPGKDGHVRVVDVRTGGGILRRPVAKLYRVMDWNNVGDTVQQNHWEGNVPADEEA